MYKKLFAFLCGIFFFFSVHAQLPATNIYLFDLKMESDTAFKFSKPRYLTAFNPNGYNNQPSFFSAKELYIASSEPYEDQTDIYMFDLEANTKLRVTATGEGEYSPQRTPNYYSFSAVREETAGRDTVLRLWQFPMDRVTNGRPVFKYKTDIGYFLWLNSYNVVAYLVKPDVSELVVVDTRTDKEIPVAQNVGRCFKKMTNGNLIYVQKDDFNPWMVMEKNMFRNDMAPVKMINTLPGSEDFEILPDGTFLMAKGSKIYKYNRYKDTDWMEVVDLRFYDISNISRMAVSPDFKLAIVAD